jgi:hypothetical protein
VDSQSDLFPFDQTHYYDEEMGTPIYRRFFSFAEMIDPAELAALKLKTNELESYSVYFLWPCRLHSLGYQACAVRPKGCQGKELERIAEAYHAAHG